MLTVEEWLAVAKAVMVSTLIPDTYELNKPVSEGPDLEQWRKDNTAGRQALERHWN